MTTSAIEQSQQAETGGTATVGEVGERALIDRIRARVPPPPASVLVGIGDDAAVVRPEKNGLQVITTDVQIEGVHFDRAFCSARDVGHRALAVNLSDLAAMGATPDVALLSLALSASMMVDDVDGLLDGLLALATRFSVALVGGNIARSPGPLFVDMMIVGSVRPRRLLTRGGARAGDDLYVSGSLGGAAAGLGMLRTSSHGGMTSGGDDECVRRYRRPEPRIRLGTLLGRNRVARACVDLSDGLADGVRQLAAASGLGATVHAEAVPVTSGARHWFERRGEDPVRATLSGGDDYELLFAVPPKARKGLRAVERLARGVPIARIGSLTADRALVLRQHGRDELLPSGFVHFG